MKDNEASQIKNHSPKILSDGGSESNTNSFWQINWIAGKNDFIPIEKKHPTKSSLDKDLNIKLYLKWRNQITSQNILNM
jgi:hypothetical protein